MMQELILNYSAHDPDNWFYRAIMWIVSAIGSVIYWFFYVVFVEILWKFIIVGAWDACGDIVHGDMPPLAKGFALLIVIVMTLGTLGAAAGGK